MNSIRATQRTVVEKYLAQAAEPECRGMDFAPNKKWAHCVVVPSLGEGDSLLRLLASLERTTGSSVLAIIVVNARYDAPAGWRETNERVIETLLNSPHQALSDAPPITFVPGKRVDILLINRSTERFFFRDKEGVGLARKIGSDLALTLWSKGYIEEGWFHNTDGDATVAADYFSVRAAPFAAGYHPFRHSAIDDRAITEATLKYERYLHYYVNGLHWAKSPYAFPTIGSTMVIDFLAYAQVRGFPKREAAEDFYLLNKLSKVGEVLEVGGEVQLASRVSTRVPFGTGASVGEILEEERAGSAWTIPHPIGFLGLRILLEELNRFSERRAFAKDTFYRRMEAIGLSSEITRRQWSLAKLDPILESGLQTRARADQLARHVRTSFDAFKTLKWVRGFSETPHAELSIDAAIAEWTIRKKSWVPPLV